MFTALSGSPENCWSGHRPGIIGNTMKSLSYCCLSFTSLLLLTAGCSTLRGPRLTPEQKQLNIESFEVVWETVRDKHYDPDLNGLDWDAIGEEYRPRVAQAETMSEVRTAMREMLNLFGQSHFGIIPASSYESIDGDDDDDAAEGDDPSGSEEKDEHGYAGIDIRVLDRKAIITAVEDGYPGAEQGIKPGWELLAVNGRETADVIDKVYKAYADSTLLELFLSRATSRKLSGDVGDKVKLRLLDGDGDTVEKEVVLVSEPGERTSIMGMPEQVVRIQDRMLDGNIGYITFTQFMHPNYLMRGFASAMTSFMKADGVIIDIRKNPGGIGALSMGMAGWLIGEKNVHLGTMSLRSQELKFVIFPRAITYDGPVAILTDGLSASTSEIFAGGLQDIGRVRVFGTRTAGAALPSMIDRLPNRDGFQYVIANYISSGGEPLEAIGVIPDDRVELTRESLLAGQDLVLEAAVDWIKTQ
jgi:carboxyl-terminal processing protease